MIDPHTQGALWLVYEAAFQEAMYNSPVRQALTHDEFIRALQDPDYDVFYAHEDDRYVGVALVTRNPEKVYWVNTVYFEHHFPAEFKEKRLIFIDGVAILPEVHRTGIGAELISALITWGVELNGVGIFDCAKSVDSILSRTLQGFGRRLDTQEFWIVQPPSG